MLLRRRSVPPKLVELWGLSKREAKALVRKETLLCVHCGAKLRARRLARVVMSIFPPHGPAPSSLREWAARPEAQAWQIAEINRIEGIHEAIADLPGLKFSDFGDESSDVSSEDLTRLSYGDSTFDLVLTSETLEHIPDLAASLSEIHRVLRPGGWHLFTIPVRPGMPKTYARSELRGDGPIVHHSPPICHPGGDSGYPVFTEFGADIVDRLDASGFETTVYFGPTTEDDLAQVYASRRR